MRLGFVTAILQEYSFEQVVDFAAEHGFKCIEVACWPNGLAERRYAGVTHIDVSAIDDVAVDHIKSYCSQRNVEISALAYYPNTLDPDLQKRAEAIEHLKKVIVAADRLGIGMVTSFIGRVSNLTVEENLELVSQVWPDIMAFAEAHHVKVAIENCPMLFGVEQWPGGQNLFTSPENWRKIFERVPSKNLGINYDPSHFVWQMIDYIEPIYEFKDKIFHVHIKDIKMYPEKLKQVGILAYPLEYMSPKLPGLGDVDWGKYMSALTDIRYSGSVCLEIEDKAFEGCEQDVLNSLILSKRNVDNYVI